MRTPSPRAREGAPQGLAPMGCLPADVNEDGPADFLVDFEGRPSLTASAFTADIFIHND